MCYIKSPFFTLNKTKDSVMSDIENLDLVELHTCLENAQIKENRSRALDLVNSIYDTAVNTASSISWLKDFATCVKGDAQLTQDIKEIAFMPLSRLGILGVIIVKLTTYATAFIVRKRAEAQETQIKLFHKKSPVIPPPPGD